LKFLIFLPAFQHSEKQMRRLAVAVLAVSTVCAFIIVTGETQEKVQSRAYAGHESDRDIQNFVRQYPKAIGTRLDDCQTCHRSGTAGTETEREYRPCG
jgi:hypothetical protein